MLNPGVETSARGRGGMLRGRRPKLLFLACYFPPAQAIAAVRTWNVAKYLSRLGWDVTVVTPEPRLLRHLENPEKAKAEVAKEGIRLILTEHHSRFLDAEMISKTRGLGWIAGGICRRIARHAGIDRGIGWIPAANRACRQLGADDVDLILASGSPYASFILARSLSKRLGRPYVLDYRDPWTKVPGMIPALQPLVAWFEAKMLAGAAAVTIVSPSWAADLESRFKVGSKVHVVTNGYVPEDLAAVKPYPFDHFSIVYAGIFYPPERTIAPIFEALKRLEMKGRSREWCFHYYGVHGDHVREAAVRLGVMDRVKLHGKVRRSEAFSAIRGANIGVVITSTLQTAGGRIQGWIPAKVFEMIGLKTPILLIAPPGTDVELIVRPTRIAHRFEGNDIEGIASFIEQAMSVQTFEQRNIDSSETSLDSFGWESLAKKIDRVLRDQLVDVGAQVIS